MMRVIVVRLKNQSRAILNWRRRITKVPQREQIFLSVNFSTKELHCPNLDNYPIDAQIKNDNIWLDRPPTQPQSSRN